MKLNKVLLLLSVFAVSNVMGSGGGVPESANTEADPFL